MRQLCTCYGLLLLLVSRIQGDSDGSSNSDAAKRIWEKIWSQLSHQQSAGKQQVDKQGSKEDHLTRGDRTSRRRRKDLFLHSLVKHYSSIQPTDQETADLWRRYSFGTFLDHQDNDAFPPFPPSKVESNLKSLRSMFIHAYDSYMLHGYPFGEVLPVTCSPTEFDLVKIPALTVIDSLDTLLILGNVTEFVRAAERIRKLNLFDANVNVSLFETTIRVLGGLLSAHQMAEAFLPSRIPYSDIIDDEGHVKWGYDSASRDPQMCWKEEPILAPEYSICHDGRDFRDVSCLRTPPMQNVSLTSRAKKFWRYNGFLLQMAIDLGERLYPAFNTETGIPYGTVNLLNGVPEGETTVASLAGAGTLCIEFELLSRLSRIPKYGEAAKLASRALYRRRSKNGLNLYGKHIDVQTGEWTETLSGIGSNSDSFLEYLAKHYFLFPEDDDFWPMFTTSYAGIFENARLGDWYVDTDMSVGLRGGKGRHVFESLMAFFPGMQVLLGEIAPSARSLNSFFLVRELLGFLPERFNFGTWDVDTGRGHASVHPLRPELLESAYFLHQSTKATKNDTHSGWQWAADFAIQKIKELTEVACGFTGIFNVHRLTTGPIHSERSNQTIKLTNEMPSFFLSETIKYLYLTFDENNAIHKDGSRQWVFTTEAHPVHYVPSNTRTLSETHEAIERLLLLKIGKSSVEYKIDDTRNGEKWTKRTDLARYEADIAHEKVISTKYRDYDSTEPHVRIFDRNPASTNIYQSPVITKLNDRGLGSGRFLRRACFNIYNAFFTWIHAVHGDSFEFSQDFQSVIDDSVVHFKTKSSSIEALGRIVLPKSRQRTCKVSSSTGTPPGPTKKDNALQLDQFRINVFDDSSGFDVLHTPSQSRIIASFVADEMSGKYVYAMVIASYALDDPMSCEAGLSDHEDAPENEQQFWRRLVMADFNGFSFTCEVELYESVNSHNRTILGVPCAPALFGPTHVPALHESGSLLVDVPLHTTKDSIGLGCPKEGATWPVASPDEGNLGGVDFVRRGECAFHEKSRHMKQSRQSQGVVVLNTEADELLVMSGDPEEEQGHEFPVTVLVTGMDGQDLLESADNATQQVGSRVFVRIKLGTSFSSQKGDGRFNLPSSDYGWPVVHGAESTLQVFAKGGWGLHASEETEGLIQKWGLQIIQYTQVAS